ncbi:Uncharacterised protein [uncultured archaeon]|nr:Uncharacterised protein [uncultured archaeon]
MEPKKEARHKGGGANLKDKEGMVKHLREHIKYPANKQQLLEACNRMSDTAPEDKEWFRKTLPDKTYQNADEVIRALNLGGPEKEEAPEREESMGGEPVMGMQGSTF